jgi:two-component system, NarL family, response regulator DevR
MGSREDGQWGLDPILVVQHRPGGSALPAAYRLGLLLGKMGARTHSRGGCWQAGLGAPFDFGGLMIAISDCPGLVRERAAPSSMQQIRLLVVDDHAAVRRGLRELLDEQQDFRVVDVVSSAEGALSVAEREPLDVAVVDYQLGGRNGLWVSRKLKRLPHPPRVVIYSAYFDGVLAAAAVVAEADGLVSKGGIGSELCDVVRSVAGGRSLLPMVPWHVAEVMRRRLSGEEQAIFGMTRAGIAPAEIAKTLRISVAGLESRMWEMLHKLETIDVELPTSGRARARAAVRAR